MNNLSEYKIAFKGLKEGDHLFEFKINDRFFDNFENSMVAQGDLIAEVVLKKQSALLILDLSVKGEVTLQCDRCLDDYRQPIKNAIRLYVKFGEEAEDQGDEIIIIPHEEYQIDVAHYLYELIILGLPIKHVHPTKKGGESRCNPEMIDQLKKYDLNREEESTKTEPPVDERWLKLKNLLDNK